jgi:probable rRNA maturation factor
MSAVSLARTRLSLSVQYAADDAGMPARGLLRKWASAALERDAQVTLRFVGENEGRELNRSYRGKDYATNVLSFSYEAGRMTRGDIVLCATVISREAREQRKSPGAHYAHLTVHGILHLRGYEHETAAAARVMERHERRILRGLGYPDPYLPIPARERA